MTEENIFNNGVIYKIQCNDDNIKDFYIGSTVNLKRRIQLHKHRYKNEKNNLKVYQTIRQNGGFINWNFSIIENVRYNNKIELLTRERHFYDILKPSLNKNRPAITQEELKDTRKEYREVNKDKIKVIKKEYREANKDKIKEYREANKERQKEYIEVNKDKIKEYQKEYREANKDKIKEYQKANKDKIKEYYKVNKDKIKDRKKEYREANKDKINECRRERRRKQKEQKEQIKNI